MKRGRAKPTWASSGMATLYSELLNSGALSLMSMTRMLKVVVTEALEGVRSSFSSVPCEERRQQGSLYFSKNKHKSAHAVIRDSCSFCLLHFAKEGCSSGSAVAP